MGEGCNYSLAVWGKGDLKEMIDEKLSWLGKTRFVLDKLPKCMVECSAGELYLVNCITIIYRCLVSAGNRWHINNKRS